MFIKRIVAAAAVAAFTVVGVAPAADAAATKPAKHVKVIDWDSNKPTVQRVIDWD